MNEDMQALLNDLRAAGLIEGEGTVESPVSLSELGDSTLSVLMAAAGPGDVLLRIIPLVNFYHSQFLDAVGQGSGMGAQDEVDDGRTQG